MLKLEEKVEAYYSGIKIIGTIIAYEINVSAPLYLLAISKENLYSHKLNNVKSSWIDPSCVQLQLNHLPSNMDVIGVRFIDIICKYKCRLCK